MNYEATNKVHMIGKKFIPSGPLQLYMHKIALLIVMTYYEKRSPELSMAYEVDLEQLMFDPGC